MMLRWIISMRHTEMWGAQGITFEIREDEIACFLGQTAGKSTLLKVISAFFTIAGECVIPRPRDHRYSPHQIVRMGLSHVPEGRQIFSRLTVIQNLFWAVIPEKQKGRDTGAFRIHF